MKKIFSKCIAAYLTAWLTFGAAYLYAQDDDMWGDFDATVPIADYVPDIPPPPPEPDPVATFPDASADAPADPFDPLRDFTGPPEVEGLIGGGEEPTFEEEEVQPEIDYSSFDLDENYSMTTTVDQSSINFIRVVRHPRKGTSEVQNAVIEGLQVSIDKGKDLEEMVVTCYFIFRDKPSSYFYEVNRKEKKLVFEFLDTRTGSSPIAALEQAPLKEIVIEETQFDANKDIAGLTPEWRDMIRISFKLEHIPVISVSDESNIISFKYKWTTNPERYKEYIEPDRFPVVFWVSGGVLGAIGTGTLIYFLTRSEDGKNADPTLKANDLPSRPSTRPAKAGASKPLFRRSAGVK